MFKADTNVSNLPGVGPKMAEKLKRLGIVTVHDLLLYYPSRYDDFTKPRPIRNLKLDESAIIEGEITSISQKRSPRKWMSIVEAAINDGSGQLNAVWFNQPFVAKILKPGQKWLYLGKVGWDFKNKIKTLSVSQYQKEEEILAVYPETEGLTSNFLRKLILPLLKSLAIDDYLPQVIKESESLIDIESAIKKIHSPKALEDIEIARKRLAFDELFLIGVRMLSVKKELSLNKAISLEIENKILKEFVKSLPFKLTDSQRKTAWEIIQDLEKEKPMNRLLEGDVGSGKTVVAAIAALLVAKNKMQSVWLAPTEILANQHYQNVSKLLSPFKIKTGLLTSANKKSDLEKDDLIIGTHALIQKDINIPRLALIIVDEQHRFGVKQRAHLRQGEGYQGKGIIPHLLSMTATPIPRTMALALYGDLDLSIIDELPPGRQKIITKVISQKNRKIAYEFIEKEITKGRQVFVICPLIEESKSNDKLFDIDKKSALKEYDKLSKIVFPKLKVGLLHGRLKSKEKDEVMQRFAKGQIDVLVATAVVEVGIDVPNATVMMIESAERFGLAQLHQFRGRVGRGKHQSYCLLFNDTVSEITQQRLSAMEHYDSGFKLAEIDLKLRGPGEFIGVRQSGVPDLKMSSLTDTILIEKARKNAELIIEDGIEKYPKLLDKLAEFESTRHLE